jgi:hypothetical protein
MLDEHETHFMMRSPRKDDQSSVAVKAVDKGSWMSQVRTGAIYADICFIRVLGRFYFYGFVS